MTWARIDDSFIDHPKARAAGKDGRCLFVASLCYANRFLTDGLIPTGSLALVAAMAEVDNPGETAQRLVVAGLWETHESGWLIHDFLEYNQSREQVLAQRDIKATRKALYADPFLTQRVKKRDQDRCRYCGIPVRWNDRRGSAGGTLDHVQPHGGNFEDNIVIACRGCNSRKGRRSPEAAGMPLHSPFGSGINSELSPNQVFSIHPYPVPRDDHINKDDLDPVDVINPKPPARKRASTEQTYSPEFEKFWSPYPRKNGKWAAWLEWGKRLKGGETPMRLIAASVNLGTAVDADPDWQIERVWHARTFIGRQRLYQDYVAGVPETARRNNSGTNQQHRTESFGRAGDRRESEYAHVAVTRIDTTPR